MALTGLVVSQKPAFLLKYAFPFDVLRSWSTLDLLTPLPS